MRSFFKTVFFKQNKTILLLLFAWIFRVTFLLQGNNGSGVAINKYVFFQIFLILMMIIYLYKNKMTPFVMIKHPVTMGFSLLYILGMISICWSVMPLMSCYFAMENLILMTVLFFISMQCKNCYEVERLFIYFVLVLFSMFIIRSLLFVGGWHSVTYSSIAAMLFMYCLAEYSAMLRPIKNVKMLKIGLLLSGFILVITTSGGACFSAALSSIALAMFARQRTVRVISLIFLVLMGGLWFSGSTDIVLGLLFPGKSMISIQTGHGRAYIFELIFEKIEQRPWLGWGYAAVERILPFYCTDAHNSIIGIRGALGNIGCTVLILAMFSVSLYFYIYRERFGSKGLMVATLCAFINSNTSNFLGSKEGPCVLTFQFLLVLGVLYDRFNANLSGPGMNTL